MALDPSEVETKLASEPMIIMQKKARKPKDEKMLKEMLTAATLTSLPGDDRHYRYVVLKNGLRCLMIHNPRTTDSKAKMRVKAGSWDEPNDIPGLAHLLEHVLFMGTETYPGTGEFQEFVHKLGGSYDGGTNDQITEFEFNIGEELFVEALDRFSKFFSESLIRDPRHESLCETRIAGEIEVVNQEFDGNLENDLFSLLHISQKYKNPLHPDARFNCGNSDSLSGVDKLVPRLREFYNKHYIANNMILALESTLSLETMEALIAENFSAIPTGKLPARLALPIQYRPEDLGHSVVTASKQGVNLLMLSFTGTGGQSIEMSQALRYVTSLLRNPGKGGLFDYLKQQGWVTEHTSSGMGLTIDYDYAQEKHALSEKAQFEVEMTFPLTVKGLDKIHEITIAVLNYIQFLKTYSIEDKQRYFKELQRCAVRTNTFFPETLNPELDNFLDNIDDYPIEQFFTGSNLGEKSVFPQEQVLHILNEMTLHNLSQFITYNSSLAEFKAEESVHLEPYTGTSYRRKPIPALLKSEELKISSELFRFPEEVMELPSNFSIQTFSEKFKFPNLILNKDRLRLWCSQDLKFRKPFIQTDLHFRSRTINETPETVAASKIYANILGYLMWEQFGPTFQMAGVSLSTSLTSESLKFSIFSFSHQHDLVILKCMDFMASLAISDEIFRRFKKMIKEEVINLEKSELMKQGIQKAQTILTHDEYPHHIMLKALKTINLKRFKEIIQLLHHNFKLEIYSHGNVLPKEVIGLGHEISRRLKFDRPIVEDVSFRRGVVELPQKAFIQHTMKLQEKNNLIAVIYQCPSMTQETRFLSRLLEAVMQPVYLYQLRTVEQLAYTPQCAILTLEGNNALLLLTESSDYTADHLMSRTDRFIESFQKMILAMSKTEFLKIREALNVSFNTSLQQDLSPRSYAEKFSPLIGSQRYQFRESFKENPYLSITLKQFQDFCIELLGIETRRRLVIKTEDGFDKDEAQKLIEELFLEHIEQNNSEEELSEDSEGSKITMESIKKNVDLILEYYQEEPPLLPPIEIDKRKIQAFKHQMPRLPNEAEAGEKWLRSLLAFKESAVSLEDGCLVEEEDVQELLEKNGLPSRPTHTILSYCFDHYRESQSSITTPSTSTSLKSTSSKM